MLSLRQRTGIQLLLCAILLFVMAPGAGAADGPAAPNVLIGADDGALEVGVWYVVDYENCGGWGLGDLPATAPDALGLRNKLTATYFFPIALDIFKYPTPRWNANITWANANAWEEDWKRSAAGGTEQFQIDTVDFAYFAGHGAASGFFFGVGGNKRDDCQVTSGDAAYSWGDRDNDWIGIAACNVLDDPLSNLQAWARAMYGTRLLMSMKTVMSDVDLGVAVGDSIRWNHSMTYAWFRAADQKLPGWQIARVLAERNDYFNDRWNKHTEVTDYDNTFHYWTHQVGQNNLPPNVMAAGVDGFRMATNQDFNGEMPVFMIEPLAADEAEAQYVQVASAFGLTDTTPITSVVSASSIERLNAVNNIFISPDGDLVMDQSAGNFQYGDSDRLWSEETLVQAANAEGMMAIDGDRALSIATNFLNQNNLMPADAFFPIVNQDIIATALDEGRSPGLSAAEAQELTIIDQTIANYQVAFTRMITFTPPSAGAAGAGQNVGVPVVGPGAKLMVYVAPQVPVTLTSASLLQDAVLGGMGGYRRVSQVMAADTNQPVTTPVRPIETITTLFNTIEDKVALSHVTLPAVQKEVLGHSFSYWEGPIGWSQDQLIPVYILNVRATLLDNSTQEYDVYIPVNETYMAPYAEILEPTGVLLPGHEVTLTAADASQTLQALGVAPSLDFALGTGDPDSYVYDWYVDDIAEENKIGTGRTISYTLPDVVAEGKPGSIKILLVVTDSLAPRQSGNTGTDDITLQFNKAYLPAVQK